MFKDTCSFDKSLYGRKVTLRSFLQSNKLISLLYFFKHPKTKGSKFLEENLLNQIINDDPKSEITKTLNKFLLSKNIFQLLD